MIFTRSISSYITQALQEPSNKVIILYGPRQAGKTTLIKSLVAPGPAVVSFTGDDLYAQKIFSKHELASLSGIVDGKKLLIIDEAQRIENIGLTLKLLTDNFSLIILASGSASFDLAKKISEPLTGRTNTFWLYPLAYSEVKEKYAQTFPQTALQEMLRFGMFPKVHTLANDGQKKDYLYEYINNYLHKDILTLENIKKPSKVIDLLTLLALQIGKEVSVAELAQNISLNQKTVNSYLDLLEKMFVIFNLRGFSRNLRKEISKSSKYYFYDTGLRNALIRNFNELSVRLDAGDLFENWFVAEKIKLANNKKLYANFYFWRTYEHEEIDLIEEREGKLHAWECKWSAKKAKKPKDWAVSYPDSDFTIVDAENYAKNL